MNDTKLEKYCTQAMDRGIAHAQLIDPGTVVTAQWVRYKCQFGCPGYNRSHCCPPHTPTPDDTQAMLDGYRRAILFHIEAPAIKGRGKQIAECYKMLMEMEGDLFKEGYYKAFLFLAGPCILCKECAYLNNAPCTFSDKARPSMEACGIDVFQTARHNGLPIETLSDQSQTQNHYCLMLVD